MVERKRKEVKEEKPRIKEKTGAKGKYLTHIEPYLDAIAAMMRTGATMADISMKFKVAEATLYEYQKKHAEFYEALKANAEIADFAVENALYKNALSGNLPAQIFWLKNRQSRRWRDKQHVFQQTTTTVRKDYDHMTDEELEREMLQLVEIVPDEETEDYEEGELH
jgi:hypothetical protein